MRLILVAFKNQAKTTPIYTTKRAMYVCPHAFREICRPDFNERGINRKPVVDLSVKNYETY